jgi:hypothetical protein
VKAKYGIVSRMYANCLEKALKKKMHVVLKAGADIQGQGSGLILRDSGLTQDRDSGPTKDRDNGLTGIVGRETSFQWSEWSDQQIVKG